MPEIAVKSASLIIERVSGELPTGFDALSAEAAGEGYRHLTRSATEWRAGRRFDRDGEALIVARLHGELAGIGGLTIDPTVPDASSDAAVLRQIIVSAACVSDVYWQSNCLRRLGLCGQRIAVKCRSRK